MRLVTWNCCRGSYERKVPLLDSLAADIAVVQECARPESESPTRLWFGDNPRQGLAVQARPPYRLKALPPLNDVPKYVIPISVTGPKRFTLLAVWMLGKPQTYPYVEGTHRAVEMYRDLLARSPTVVLGDLNSNTIWDHEHKPHSSHSGLVARLADLGLVSAYHHCLDEAHGSETQPTFYFQWKKERPYHIDYCFLPRKWVKKGLRVEIGSYEEWRAWSDHRPLLVEVGDVR
jgi:exonuclease III